MPNLPDSRGLDYWWEGGEGALTSRGRMREGCLTFPSQRGGLHAMTCQ